MTHRSNSPVLAQRPAAHPASAHVPRSQVQVSQTESSWRNGVGLHFANAETRGIRRRTWTALAAVTSEASFQTPIDASLLADHSRLAVILEEVGGELKVQVDAETTGGRQALAEKQVIYAAPGTSIRMQGTNIRRLRQICLHFDVQNLSGLVQDGPTLRLGHIPQAKLRDPRLFNLVRLFEEECKLEGATDIFYGDNLSVSLLLLLCKLCECNKIVAVRGGLSPRQLKLATEYMESNFSTEVTVDALASLVGLSASHFCRLFKRETTVSPHKWLRELRIRKAQALLVDDRQSLVEIALMTGFADQSHMTRVFTQLIGVSPGAWRKQHDL